MKAMPESRPTGRQKSQRRDRGHGFVIGGPYDGTAVVAGGRRKGLFAWINEQGRRYDRPGRERYLHRAELWHYARGETHVAWVYAENVYRLCGNCGAFYQLAEGGSETPDCQLCGASPDDEVT